MNSTLRTHLEAWIKSKIGLGAGEQLTPEALSTYQLTRLNHTLSYARGRSAVYRNLLKGMPDVPLARLEELFLLPFTSADDLSKHHLQMLCVSQSEVARVVTLQTSGTTSTPKRLYFTDADLELTIDFFRHGMSTLVRPGQKVLILMPGTAPASVGDLLAKALSRMDVQAIVHGPVKDPALAIKDVIEHSIDCLVGIPVQVLGMARHSSARRIRPGTIKSVLLSTDYVPQAIADELTNTWECEVFEHYGMTEMGLGGGVDCGAHAGYHLREADLFFEIINPDSGRPVEPGRYGEVVFTTLTRRGMPLIRYRTGDLACMVDSPCPCGSMLRRMSKVAGRLAGRVELGESLCLTMGEIDEVVLTVPGVLDYQVEIAFIGNSKHLCLAVHTNSDSPELTVKSVEEALFQIPVIRKAISKRELVLEPVVIGKRNWFTNGTAKRGFVFDGI